jgi:hypothetical protein
MNLKRTGWDPTGDDISVEDSDLSKIEAEEADSDDGADFASMQPTIKNLITSMGTAILKSQKLSANTRDQSNAVIISEEPAIKKYITSLGNAMLTAQYSSTNSSDLSSAAESQSSDGSSSDSDSHSNSPSSSSEDDEEEEEAYIPPSSSSRQAQLSSRSTRPSRTPQLRRSNVISTPARPKSTRSARNAISPASNKTNSTGLQSPYFQQDRNRRQEGKRKGTRTAKEGSKLT